MLGNLLLLALLKADATKKRKRSKAYKFEKCKYKYLDNGKYHEYTDAEHTCSTYSEDNNKVILYMNKDKSFAINSAYIRKILTDSYMSAFVFAFCNLLYGFPIVYKIYKKIERNKYLN